MGSDYLMTSVSFRGDEKLFVNALRAMDTWEWSILGGFRLDKKLI